MRPGLFLNLLWLPLAVAVAVFVTRQGEAARCFHDPKLALSERSESNGSTIHNPKCDPTAPNDILQFTSAGHILGFAADAAYVAGSSHALRVNSSTLARPSRQVLPRRTARNTRFHCHRSPTRTFGTALHWSTTPPVEQWFAAPIEPSRMRMLATSVCATTLLSPWRMTGRSASASKPAW